MKTYLSPRRLFPRIRYTNFHKSYPMTKGIWKTWFSIQRYWSGRLININLRHHQLVLDFRGNALDDLAGKKLT